MFQEAYVLASRNANQYSKEARKAYLVKQAKMTHTSEYPVFHPHSQVRSISSKLTFKLGFKGLGGNPMT